MYKVVLITDQLYICTFIIGIMLQRKPININNCINVEYIKNKQFGIMVAVDGEQTKAVPLQDAAGKINYVPHDHPWIQSARNLETSFGD